MYSYARGSIDVTINFTLQRAKLFATTHGMAEHKHMQIQRWGMKSINNDTHKHTYFHTPCCMSFESRQMKHANHTEAAAMLHTPGWTYVCMNVLVCMLNLLPHCLVRWIGAAI